MKAKKTKKTNEAVKSNKPGTAKTSPTSVATQAGQEINFAAMVDDLGGSYWDVEHVASVLANPIATIGDAKHVCERATLDSEVWRTAWARWSEFSRAKIASANDIGSAVEALMTVPRYSESERQYRRVENEVAGLAVLKAVSFAKSVSDIRSIVEKASNLSIWGYNDYPKEVIERMFGMAKSLDDLLFIHSVIKGEEVTSSGWSSLSFKVQVRKRIVTMTSTKFRRKQLADANRLIARCPTEIRGELARKAMKIIKPDEAKLRDFRSKSSLRDYDDKTLFIVVGHALDTIMWNKVQSATRLVELERLQRSCDGLPQSSSFLQKKLNERLLTTGFSKAKTFAEFKKIFLVTNIFDLRERCFQKMITLVTNVGLAQELWRLARTNTDGTDRRLEAEVVWSGLIGDSKELADQMFKDTGCLFAYEKRLSLIQDFNEAVSVWDQAANRDPVSKYHELGLRKALECMSEVGDGLELIARFSGNGDYTNGDLTKIVKRTLELAREKKHLVRIARSVIHPTWEIRAMIVKDLIPHYLRPATAAEPVGSRAGV